MTLSFMTSQNSWHEKTLYFGSAETPLPNYLLAKKQIRKCKDFGIKSNYTRQLSRNVTKSSKRKARRMENCKLQVWRIQSYQAYFHLGISTRPAVRTAVGNREVESPGRQGHTEATSFYISNAPRSIVRSEWRSKNVRTCEILRRPHKSPYCGCQAATC